jgi:hypothetical protein
VIISGVPEHSPTDTSAPALSWDFRDEICKVLEIELPTAETGALRPRRSYCTTAVMSPTLCTTVQTTASSKLLDRPVASEHSSHP